VPLRAARSPPSSCKVSRTIAGVCAAHQEIAP
jgi:hypothetical protein